MDKYMVQAIFGTDGSSNRKKSGISETKADVWQKVIENLIDPTSGMDEQESKEYEQKILQKLKTGRRLTSEELDYLRIHNPEMYRTAMRVETARSALKERLKSCKSKEEVQQVVSAQMEVLDAMKNDPDWEYMSAMVQKEVEDFMKSSRYARLPQNREDGEKKEKEISYDYQKEQEEYGKVLIYTRTQFQCDRILEMAQSFI